MSLIEKIYQELRNTATQSREERSRRVAEALSFKKDDNSKRGTKRFERLQTRRAMAVRNAPRASVHSASVAAVKRVAGGKSLRVSPTAAALIFDIALSKVRAAGSFVPFTASNVNTVRRSHVQSLSEASNYPNKVLPCFPPLVGEVAKRADTSAGAKE